MKLYGDMLKKYERYINAVMEGYEVIRRYDDLWYAFIIINYVTKA